MVHAIGIRRKEDGFFAVDDFAFRGVARPGGPMHCICQWFGVECDPNGAVRSVSWESFTRLKLRYLYLVWLPSTVRDIHITGQKDADMDDFDTRQIPKSTVDVFIQNCGMQGTVDVFGLTVVIEKLEVPLNCLSGTVFVGFLPPTLKVLNVMESDRCSCSGQQLTARCLCERHWASEANPKN